MNNCQKSDEIKSSNFMIVQNLTMKPQKEITFVRTSNLEVTKQNQIKTTRLAQIN